LRAAGKELVTGKPEMPLVTASRAAKSRVLVAGGAAPHDDRRMETATTRSGRWKLNMSAPGQDTTALTPGTVRHKSEHIAKPVSGLCGQVDHKRGFDISTIMDMSVNGYD
jgi:hypothetical protein